MNAVITIPKSGNEHLIEVFAPEDKSLSNGRGEYTITTDEENITFTITASDAVALRAIMSSVTKVLSIHHKMNQI